MHLRSVLGLDCSWHIALPQAFSFVRAKFLNAFSVLNETGAIAAEFSLQQYRGNFSPEFLPRRFVLKDTLYEQDLYILQLLKKWEDRRYRRAGVGYVEFSVSVYDILRP